MKVNKENSTSLKILAHKTKQKKTRESIKTNQFF